MKEWISVEDDLPEINKQVLTYSNNSCRMPIKVNYIFTENQWAYGAYDNITHWMPLPEPPK